MVTPAPALSPTYFLTGKDEYLKEEALTKLYALVFGDPSERSLNCQRFTGGEDPLGAALDFIRTAPFIGSKRMAVMRSVEALSSEEKEQLLAYAEKPAPTGVLVLISEEGTPKKDPFLRTLAERSETITCHTPFDRDLPGWLDSRLRRLGKTATRDCLRVLIERVGKDTALLAAAAEQLALYAGDRSQVSQEDAERLFGPSLQGDSFLLAERFIAGDGRGAVEVFTSVTRDGTRAHEVLAALASQLEKLARVCRLLKEGKDRESIGSELGAHPFYLEKLLRQAGTVSLEQVQGWMTLLLEADSAVKTGRMSDRLAFEYFLLKGTTGQIRLLRP